MNNKELDNIKEYFWNKLDDKTKVNINNLNSDLYFGPLENFNFSSVADDVTNSIDEIICNNHYYDSFSGEILESLPDDLSEVDYEEICELDKKFMANLILGNELTSTLFR
jgi:hypothetical protein